MTTANRLMAPLLGEVAHDMYRPHASGDDLNDALVMAEHLPAGPRRAFVQRALNEAISALSCRTPRVDGFYSFTAFVGALAWVSLILEPAPNRLSAVAKRGYAFVALRRSLDSLPRRQALLGLGRYATRNLGLALDLVAQDHLFELAVVRDAETLWKIARGEIAPPSADDMMRALIE